MTEQKSTEIETTVCARCGGSGKFSYNAMHGDRCYGCRGTGKVYTKRGKAAAAYLSSLREIPIQDFKVGDLFQVNAGPLSSKTVFSKIVSIEFLPGIDVGYVSYPDEPCFRIKTANGSGLIGFLKSHPTHRKGFTLEEKQEQFRQALAYQDTLTKEGKPRKK
jgi:hypothetical protein